MIKIKGRNKELYERTLKNVLDVTFVICSKGYFPTEWDIEKPERSGKYWLLEEENNRYNIVPTNNNYWLNIKNKGENFVVLDFNCRYDKDNKKKNIIIEEFDKYFKIDFLDSP
jgi:hypothetical protein